MNSKFKIISMGRVGTMAINRYVNSHPQLSLPAYNETTRVFCSSKENVASLLTDQSQQSKKQGIIIHDAVFFDKKHRKKMVAMNNIKVDSLVHMVRNPYDMVKSWINHINASSCMGVLGWKKITPTAESFYSQYPGHFQTIFPGRQCRTLYKNYRQLKVIDFPSLRPEQIEQTMASLHDFLGVNSSYRSALLHDKQNTYTNQLLKKGIDFKLNNEVIGMSMWPVDAFFHQDKNAKPWVTIHDTEKIYGLCPTLPKAEGDLVFMPKSVAAHNRLSFKTRKMLSEGISDIVGEILPVWAKNTESIAQQIEAIKLNALSDADHAFVANMLKEDLDIFCRYHPEFKTLWDL